MLHLRKIPISIILILTLTIIFTSCASDRSSPAIDNTFATDVLPSNTDQIPQLKLTVTPDPDVGYITITPEELNGMYDSAITYFEFSDVFIEINGESFSLSSAIRESRISVDEIIAYARSDAKEGHCIESYTSNLGLSRYSYCYPDYELFYSHDIFESSSGQQYLIQSFSVYPPNRFDAMWSDFTVLDENGKEVSIYSEDWGVSFEVIEASASSLEINCTQKGGIQIGQLFVNGFSLLYAGKEMHYVPKITAEATNFPETQIDNNSVNKITIDWIQTHGKLPVGDYFLKLYIQEKYDPSSVSPLTRNYTDQQEYIIPFTIY